MFKYGFTSYIPECFGRASSTTLGDKHWSTQTPFHLLYSISVWKHRPKSLKFCWKCSSVKSMDGTALIFKILNGNFRFRPQMSSQPRMSECDEGMDWYVAKRPFQIPFLEIQSPTLFVGNEKKGYTSLTQNEDSCFLLLLNSLMYIFHLNRVSVTFTFFLSSSLWLV